MKKIYILGGGTFSHVRTHLALATPAFGETAKTLHESMLCRVPLHAYQVHLVLTKMADSKSNLVTNEDVEKYLDILIQDPDTKAIIFNIALTDYNGEIEGLPSGKYAERLKTSEGDRTLALTPTKKLIGKIRKHRKDIFVVGFKTTAGATSNEQYVRGLELLKKNSLNLVLSNDVTTRNNMIIAPEETRYSETTDRQQILSTLATMTLFRMRCTFTRSTVIPGDAISWATDEMIPDNLKEVVNHCIQSGAYKPFLGKTAGHFAVKINEDEILTSIRKTNFNQLKDVGLVRVTSQGRDTVIAHGFKPSVGGQSQRIIFKEHPEAECIVHFHCPVREELSTQIASELQWPNECGSHECGKTTSRGLKAINLDGDFIKVVYLENHGPNIVFNRHIPAKKVIDFIDRTFDLSAKTGGLV